MSNRSIKELLELLRQEADNDSYERSRGKGRRKALPANKRHEDKRRKRKDEWEDDYDE